MNKSKYFEGQPADRTIAGLEQGITYKLLQTDLIYEYSESPKMLEELMKEIEIGVMPLGVEYPSWENKGRLSYEVTITNIKTKRNHTFTFFSSQRDTKVYMWFRDLHIASEEKDDFFAILGKNRETEKIFYGETMPINLRRMLRKPLEEASGRLLYSILCTIKCEIQISEMHYEDFYEEIGRELKRPETNYNEISDNAYRLSMVFNIDKYTECLPD